MTYIAKIVESDEGFSVSVPGLSGCASEGKTEKEALKNIKIAIREYLAAVKKLSRGSRTRRVKVAY